MTADRIQSTGPEHAVFSARLRAPRAAIIIPTASNWQFIAATAIFRASRMWGGAGFILIPHMDGVVNAVMLRIAAAYDPDYVVTISDASIAALVEAGCCEWELPEKLSTPEKLRARGVKQGLGPKDKTARDAVSRACSPYRHGIRGETSRDDRVSLAVNKNFGSGHFREVVAQSTDEPEPPLSFCNPAERDLALFLADRYGISREPSSTFEPAELDVSRLQTVVNQEVEWQPKTAFDRWNSEKSSWKPTLEGLLPVGSPAFGSKIWVVVGSSLLDFSLGYALSRIDSQARWFPAEWLNNASPLNYFAELQLSDLRFANPNQIEEVVVTSTSLDSEQLKSELGELANEDPEEVHGSPLTIAPIYDVGSAHGSTHLVLRSDYDKDLVLPVTHPLPEGVSIWLVTAIPAILPETHTESDLLSRAIWHVDVEPHRSSMPTGRGLSWESLQDPNAPWPERVRSGRDGLSVTAGSFGLVSGAATLRQSLARPQLRFPAGLDWIKSMCSNSGYTVAISDAGHRANIAANLWGGRHEMSDSISNDLLMLTEFLAKPNQSSSARRYPEGDGCVIRGEGFLTMEAFVRVSQASAELQAIEVVRRRTDAWCQAGILRRGLVLKCLDCDRVQWIDARRIGGFQCDRCQADIPLVLQAWKYPTAEPRWYYDLHPVVRELLQDFGHVPVLTGMRVGEKLRGETYTAPEIVFERDAKRQFELDLLVTSSLHLAVGECKNRPTVPIDERKRKLHTLTESALLFQANEIILASGESGSWDSTFVTALRDRVTGANWRNGRQPRIALLTDVYRTYTCEYVAT